MRKVIYLLMLVIVGVQLSSCSKEQIQQKVEDMVVQVMVDGVWIVTKYEENGTDMTALLQGWECQFYENRTCTAKKGGATINGTWDGSYTNQTMTANFASPPLDKFNATWQIKRSTYTTGQFERTENGVVYKIEIMKK